AHPLDHLQTVVQIDELLHFQEAIKDVYVDDLIEEYIVALTTATRHHEDIYLGASTRGSLALYRVSQAWAAIKGRDYVAPDDVKDLAGAVLSHRMIINPAARIRSVTPTSIIQDVLSGVPVPGARAGRRYNRVA
ncbi:MAG: MoxR family ATPase, partial [Oscillochloris sp.]|nr:MoxR family ATPase [Oscillochloris sp.]